MITWTGMWTCWCNTAWGVGTHWDEGLAGITHSSVHSPGVTEWGEDAPGVTQIGERMMLKVCVWRPLIKKGKFKYHRFK